MSSEIGVPPPSDGVATLQSDTEAARKEKLRVAGEEYFQRILAQTGTANLPPQSTKERPSGPALSVPGYDPDLEQIGGIVEGARTYLLGTLFVISQAASIVFIKVRAACRHMGGVAHQGCCGTGVPRAPAAAAAADDATRRAPSLRCPYRRCWRPLTCWLPSARCWRCLGRASSRCRRPAAAR
jgi:hypothetical protein